MASQDVPGGAHKPKNATETVLRDFSPWISAELSSTESEAGKWRLRNYRLADGTPGVMLAVDLLTQHQEDVPPLIEIPLDLEEGWYQVSFASPILDHQVLVDFPTGIDVAFDDAPFIHVGPEYGIRKGRILAELDRELWTFFRTLYLSHSVLRLRPAGGTFFSQPLGMVRATLSAIRFQRTVKPEQHAAGAKPVLVVSDGFSHYWASSREGEEIDIRLAEACRDSDVTKILLQTPCTGLSCWQSEITSYLGQGIRDDEQRGKRYGDLRAARYMRWMIENHRENFRVLGKACKERTIEIHASIRMNLFFQDDSPYIHSAEHYFNGTYWEQHPELRLSEERGTDGTRPSVKWDYSLKDAQAYLLAMYEEILERFDSVDGIHLDLTRWPPVLPVGKTDKELLPDLLAKLRALLRRFEQKRRRHYALSISVVEGYHAGMSLEEQTINLDRILNPELLDFICVQSYQMQEIAASAQKAGIPCYAILEQTSPYYPDGMLQDPNWRLADGSIQDDPVAGEERLKQPPLKSCLTPLEMQQFCVNRYREGADGICMVNRFHGSLSLRQYGHSEELMRLTEEDKECGQDWGERLFFN